MQNKALKKLLVSWLIVLACCASGKVDAAEVYLPHITGGESTWGDYLQVNNTDWNSHDFTITLYSGGAEVYTDEYSVAGYDHQLIDLKYLYSLAETGKISFTSDALLFRLSYEYDGGGVAEFSLTGTLSSQISLLYSEFIDSVTAKGAAIANMGDTDAAVTLYAIGNDMVLDSYSTTIGAHEKIIDSIVADDDEDDPYQPHSADGKAASSWFPDVSFSEIESIIAESGSDSLSGIVICTDSYLSYLLFTPGHP